MPTSPSPSQPPQLPDAVAAGAGSGDGEKHRAGAESDDGGTHRTTGAESDDGGTHRTTGAESDDGGMQRAAGRPPERGVPDPDGHGDGGRRRSTDPVLSKALPIGAAVAAYGISYGVLAVAAGLSPLVATLSSVAVLAGGSQFAFVGVLAAGGNPFAGAVAGLLLNVRYLAFGFAIAPRLPSSPLPRRLVDGYLVVDESVAFALAGPHRDAARRFRVVGVTVVVAWIGATALGAYGGQVLGDPEVLGLDAAFPAGFLALLAPWLRRRSGRVAAAVGVVLALGLTPIAPPGVPILAAGLGALVARRVVDDVPAGRAPAGGSDHGDSEGRPALVADIRSDGGDRDGPTTPGADARTRDRRRP
jgi:predicted branched-subunit amino acid permease